MATLTPTIGKPAPQPKTGGGGRDLGPPPDLGGGGGRGGDNFFNYGQRLRRARLGLLLATAPIITLFVVLTLVYLVRRETVVLDPSGLHYINQWKPVTLPLRLLLANTLVLLLSSVTVELARRQITLQSALAPLRSIPGITLGREFQFPWLASTLVLGMAFLGGQWLAWRSLAAHGFFVATSPRSSFIYVLTATHAVHLLGGLVVLLYTSTVSMLNKSVESRRIVVDVTAWYWHLMLLLWIYVFAFLWVAR
jgi:cytochrome c oxidase subunit III